MDGAAQSHATLPGRVAQPAWIVLGAGVLLAFGYLGRPLLSGEVHTASDLGNFYLPFRAFYADCLAEGHRFTWYPYEFTGFYLHGEGQLGLFHPLNWLQYRLLPLSVAFNLELLRGYGFLIWGLFLLLRRWELPRAPALFGACLFTFSSFTVQHYMHLNIVGALAHAPWLLFASEDVLRHRGARGVWAALAVFLLTASLCSIGHPQLVWIIGVVELFYAVRLIALLRREEGPDWERAAYLAGAKILGVAGAGVALLPLLESLALSSARAAPGPGFTSDLTTNPQALMQLVAPYRLEGGALENAIEQAFYLGAVPLVLGVWVFVRRGALGSSWRLARATSILAAVALLLSFGDAGQLYRLQSLLPWVGLFRAPVRYLVIVELAAAVLAAIALADLARGGDARRARHPALWLPFAASVAVAVFSAPLAGDAPLAGSTHRALAGPVLIAIATALLFASARRWRGALTALVALAFIDVGLYGWTFVHRSAPQPVAEYAARFAVLGRPGPDRLHWGVPALTLRGMRLASGYVAMTPDRVLDLEPFGVPLVLDARLRNALRVSTVRWALGTRLPAPLPRARLVAHAKVTTDANRDIAAIDVETTALVDRKIELDPGAGGTAEIAVDAPGDVQIVTNAPGRRLLVLAERHHEGWRVEVDGAPSGVLRAYGDYLACVVPPGRHEVRWRFAPASLRRGMALSIAALVVALGGTLVRLRLARR